MKVRFMVRKSSEQELQVREHTRKHVTHPTAAQGHTLVACAARV